MDDAKPQILQWTAPGCPYRITIPAPVINHIRILSVEAFYSVPRGGVEIGGVFFGVREPDALHIRAYRPIPCQYSTGPSFTLSIKDQLGLSGLLEESLTAPDLAGMEALGWYHSHTRSEIFLTPVDLQLYSEFFPERWQIAMVLRPANLQPTRAGFFFRDRFGAVKSNPPVQEIKLEPPSFGMEPIAGDLAGPAHERVVPAATAPDLAPSVPAGVPLPVSGPAPLRVVEFPAPTALRIAAAVLLDTVPPAHAEVASVVPDIVPHAHAAVASAVPDIVPHAQAAVASVVPDTVPHPHAAVASAVPDIEAVAPPPETVVAQRKPEAIPAPEPTAPAQIDVPGFLAAPKVRTPLNTVWIWILAAVVLLCGAGGAAVLNWDRFAGARDLGLETYDINGAFLIRWDRDSRVVRNATRATLDIQDGGERTPIDLTPAELGAGGYGYIRRTGQVSVRMKVEGAMPTEEYSNFNSSQSLGSQPPPAPEKESGLGKVLQDREHLRTELINESMQSLELRREINSLRRQLAEERAKTTPAP